MKLSAHRAGLPGKAISFYIVPLAPPTPLWRDGARSGQNWRDPMVAKPLKIIRVR